MGESHGRQPAIRLVHELSLVGYTAERRHGWVRRRSASLTRHSLQAFIVPRTSSALLWHGT